MSLKDSTASILDSNCPSLDTSGVGSFSFFAIKNLPTNACLSAIVLDKQHIKSALKHLLYASAISFKVTIGAFKPDLFDCVNVHIATL